jgi:hypothetical protein
MAYAEQQQWVTVQQKTFTKWLNTKLEVRNLVVKDLVKDLSDGVRVLDLPPLKEPSKKKNDASSENRSPDALSPTPRSSSSTSSNASRESP